MLKQLAFLNTDYAKFERSWEFKSGIKGPESKMQNARFAFGTAAFLAELKVTSSGIYSFLIKFCTHTHTRDAEGAGLLCSYTA